MPLKALWMAAPCNGAQARFSVASTTFLWMLCYTFCVLLLHCTRVSVINWLICYSPIPRQKNTKLCFSIFAWFGYPMVKKMKIRLLVLTEFTNVTDRRTDTAWLHRPHLHSSLLSSLLYGAWQLLNCLALRPSIGPNALPLINQKPNDKGEGLYPP